MSPVPFEPPRLSREFDDEPPFPTERERLAALEVKVEGNGAGLQKLEQMFAEFAAKQDQRDTARQESTEELRTAQAADRVATALVLGEIKGEMKAIHSAAKTLVWVVGVSIPLVGIGLAILNLVLRK